MYLFFDRQGTLLEIVNDVAMRQYNTNVNKIYVHIQDDTAPESGRIPKHIVALKHWYLPYGKTAKDSIYGNPAVRPGTLTSEDTIWDENKDGTVSDSEKPATNSFVRETIPYNRNRDLKHFVYGRTYEFFVLNIPSGGFTATPCTSEGCMCAELSQEGDVFNFSGLVQGTIQTVHYDHSCLALERFSFTIEDSVLLPEKAVTGSQFSWLLTELLSMSGKVNGLDDYNNILANKPIINADLSSAELVADTYYKHTGEDGTYKTGVIYYYNGTKLIAIDGGTSLTLNGEETDNAAIYAPTKSGNKYQVLLSNGSGEPQWATVSIEKNGLNHTIKLGDGHEVGTITLSQETYIDSIDYNPDTHIVTFKYNGASGKRDETVDLNGLYTAGNGLQQIGNEFSIKTDGTYLSTSTNGLTVAAQSIADFAKINLNGSTKITKNTSFYAPTTVGSSGQVLLSDGSGAPSWSNFKVNSGSVGGKSIYAPTTTRSSNTNDSCYVLVPDTYGGAPKWERITVTKSSDGLECTFKIGNYQFAKINLTQEVYLDSVVFDEENNDIIFTYNTASGKSEIRVELDKLMNTYEAGNGLVRDNGVFSIKIAPDSEKYLKATAEGLVFDESALPKQGATGNGGAFIVKTEDEMNALLLLENVGALVSYVGEGDGATGGAYEKDALYLITEQEVLGSTPIKEGDTVDTLYFNTALEALDFSALTAEEGYVQLIVAGAHNDYGLYYYDMSVLTEGEINAECIIIYMRGYDDGPKTIYSTSAFNWESVTASAGWNLDQIAWGDSVAAIDQQTVLDTFVSATPFTNGGTEIVAKQIGGESGGNTEEIDKAVSELSNKIDKIVAPTTTREVNTDNSCYVLTPNGESEPTWERIAVTTSDNLSYNVTIGGKNAGTINLTQEIYLDSVAYNSDTNKLTFTYNTSSGKSSIEVDLSDLAGGNVALPESHSVTIGGISWTGATLGGKTCYVSSINLSNFGFTSNITSGGALILSPLSSSDAEYVRTFGVFHSIKFNDGTLHVYAQSPAVMLGFPEIHFSATYIPAADTGSSGAVIIQNTYDGVDISTITLSPDEWQTYWGDENYDGEANEFLYHQSPVYVIDYTSYVVFMPADTVSKQELINCGAYETTDITDVSYSGAYPWAIRLLAKPTNTITLKKMTIWTAEALGVATLVLPKAPSIPRVSSTSQNYAWIPMDGTHWTLSNKIVEVKAEITETYEAGEGTGATTIKTQYLTGPVLFPSDYVPSGHTGMCPSTTLVVNGIKMYTDMMGYAQVSGIDGASYYYRMIKQ